MPNPDQAAPAGRSGVAGAASPAAAGVTPPLEPGHTGPWETAVKRLLDELTGPDQEPVAWPEAWWERWRQRLAEFFGQNKTGFAPYWSDVVARAAGAPAAAWLDLDLGRMTMRAWSELLLLALETAVHDQVSSPAAGWKDLLPRALALAPSDVLPKGQGDWGVMLFAALNAAAAPNPWPSTLAGWDAVAPWLAIPAVDRLGFGRQVEPSWRALGYNKLLPGTYPDASPMAWVGKVLDPERWREPHPIGCVVAAPGSSFTAAWPAPARYGGLLLDRDRWQELSKSFVSQPTQTASTATPDPAQPVVLVEPGDPAADESQLESTLRLVESLSGSRSSWLYIVPAAAAEKTRTDRPVIRDPKDFDDAMDQALKARAGA